MWDNLKEYFQYVAGSFWKKPNKYAEMSQQEKTGNQKNLGK